jgi:hypothetical protein
LIITTVSHSRAIIVDEMLTHERVEIERMPIGRPAGRVDAEQIPTIQEDGNVMIVRRSDCSEVLAAYRQWALKQEVLVRRVSDTVQHREVITIRDQEGIIAPSGAAEGDSRSVGQPGPGFGWLRFNGTGRRPFSVRPTHGLPATRIGRRWGPCS